MMTLLLRLQGPMQAWGTQSRFEHRDTGREPSKSGVIGVICAALGRSRETPVDDLVALRMGVRVDREGQVKLDYHTAGGGSWRGKSYGVAKSDGSRGDPVVSRRLYLTDADFLVGLEGDGVEQEALLHEIDAHLDTPHWLLCLGRKAFVPGVPPRLPDQPPFGPGLQQGSLLDVFKRYPWPEENGKPLPTVRIVCDDAAGTSGEVRRDVPVSFAIGKRSFRDRSVRTEFLSHATFTINTFTD